METVPLYGRIAAGRVALVDDGDFELVSAYRWNAWQQRMPCGRLNGPYAVTSIYVKGAGTRTVLRMHTLITGYSETDHINHDGLDNQRHNLRPATSSQNKANRRKYRVTTSAYKGVFWYRGKWRALITIYGKSRRVGTFASELEAAYAYDEAARKLFGEFAYPNFPDGPEQAMRDQWQAERDSAAASRAKRPGHNAAWWEQRTPEMRTCSVCGGEYLSRASRPPLYCSGKCNAKACRQRKREGGNVPYHGIGLLGGNQSRG